MISEIEQLRITHCFGTFPNTALIRIPYLQELHIINCSIEISDGIRYLPSLESLILEGVGFKQIPDVILELVNLKQLNMSNNTL
jgi:Leucine-rich repeat (LRR) protein